MNTLRLGVGYGGDVGSIRMYGVAEYLKPDFNIDDEGDDGNGRPAVRRTGCGAR